MKNFLGAKLIQTEKINHYVVGVTPKLALEWLTTFKYPYQRQVRSRNVRRLGTLIESESFLTEATDIRFVELPSGERFIINGQHLLSLISTKPEKTIITVQVIVDKVPDMKRAATLYMALDNNSTRTISDILGASGMIDNFPSIPRNLAATAVRAMRLISSSFAKAPLPLDKMKLTEMAITEYSKELEAYHQAVICTKAEGKFQHKFMFNTGITAACLARLKSDPKSVRPFIQKVLDLSGVRPNDPAITVRDLFLLQGHASIETPGKKVLISAWHFAVLVEAAFKIDGKLGAMTMSDAKALLTNKDVAFGDTSSMDIEKRRSGNERAA